MRNIFISVAFGLLCTTVIGLGWLGVGAAPLNPLGFFMAWAMLSLTVWMGFES